MLNYSVAELRDNINGIYNDCVTNNIQVFSDTDNQRYTFEVCIYDDNKELLDNEFSNLKRNTTLQFMLANKAETAYRILIKHADKLNVPQYIQNAIKWIDA